MTRRFLTILSLLLFTFAPARASAQLKKISFAVGSISQVEAPFNLAKLKGFYREEGLDVDIILIRGALGVQALVGGSVDRLVVVSLTGNPCSSASKPHVMLRNCSSFFT